MSRRARAERIISWGSAVVFTPALAALVIPSMACDAPFQPGDDYSLILGNPLVRTFSFDAARELATSIHSDLYQPLPMLSFQLNYALSADRPFSYHLVNLILHVACTILVATLTVRVTENHFSAMFAGVLFAMHPLATDAVGWISGRIMLLAALFALGLLNLFAWRRTQPGSAWAGGSMLAGAGMLLSKVIPGVPIAAAWLDAWMHEPQVSLRKRSVIWWLVIAALAVMTLVMTAISLNTIRTAAMTEAAEAAGVPAAVRMLLALRYYIENFFLPTRLTVWSPVPRDAGWHSSGVWIAAAEAAALAVLAWLARRRMPFVTIGLGLFAILLMPFLAAVGVRNFLTADRYMYLPMAGLTLAVGGAIGHAYRATRLWSSAAIGLSFVVVVFCLLAADSREVKMRRDIISVAKRAMQLYPGDVRIPVKLSKIYNETGRPHEALATIADARRRWPDDPALAGEAGAAYRTLGNWNAAQPELQLAVAGQPDDLRARYHLGLTLDDLNQSEAAAEHYRGILAIRSDYVPAATALARNCRRAGRLDEALAYFEQALKTNPRHRAAVLSSVSILEQLGRNTEAERMLRKYLELSPGDQEAALQLQNIHARADQSTIQVPLTTSAPTP